jgi:uncharacterized protein (TIGR02266 family)
MENENRRSQKRTTRRLVVHFGQEDPTNLGFAKNVSLNGLEIFSKVIYKPETVLNLMMQPAADPIAMKGVVRWVTENDQFIKKENLQKSMGIKLLASPESYIDYILDATENYQEKRIEPRYGKVVKVIFEKPQDLLDAFTQDISKGGVFITTEMPPTLNTLVRVRMIIAEPMIVIRADGRVVHIISKEEARRLWINPGCGIQFESFMEKDRELLDNYIKDLQSRSVA